MNVVVLRYGKHTRTYRQTGTALTVGLEGVEGEITCGTMEGDVWYSIESHLRIYKKNDTPDGVDLHIVLQDIPDDVVAALVQSVGDDIVAVTPLTPNKRASEYRRLVTSYLQVGGQV